MKPRFEESWALNILYQSEAAFEEFAISGIFFSLESELKLQS